MGRTRAVRMSKVATAGTPTIQIALTPSRQASSVETRSEAAPIHEAQREKATRPAPRRREARKKESRLPGRRRRPEPGRPKHGRIGDDGQDKAGSHAREYTTGRRPGKVGRKVRSPPAPVSVL